MRSFNRKLLDIAIQIGWVIVVQSYAWPTDWGRAMARDSLYAEIARQREAELRRTSERRSLCADAQTPGRRPRARAREALTIRLAATENGRELELLARPWRSRVSLRVVLTLSRGLLPR
jgi:hypothetical protein